MDRRIFGIETEYGVTCISDGRRRLTPDEVSRYLFRKVVSWGRSSNVFLSNGARLYLDVGSHPEYATAECDDIRDAVIQDKAGERIVEGLAEDATARMREDEIDGEIFIFKNNVDSAGNSYGCHENFLIARASDFARLSDTLLPFLVTRQIICGAGKIDSTSAGATFSFSQRADHVWEGVSSATTRSRPIINTRDEPHADAESYRRLHVIVGDSNLRLIETAHPMHDMTVESPIRAIRDISHDLTGSKKIKLANLRQLSAVEIQREFLAAATAMVAREGAKPHDAVVLELWGRALDAVERQDFALIDREIDWAIKHRLLTRYQARHDLAWSDPRMAQLDLAFHDINRRRGLFYLLERAGQVERLCSDVEIFAAKTRPPQTTRAKLRGDFVKLATAAQRDFTVDWVHLKLNDGGGRTILLKDPFAAVDDRVERLLAGLRDPMSPRVV